MTSTLALQAILSFAFGAGLVLVVTVIAEKFGSKVGGIASGLPGSVMLSLLFIGIHHGTEFAARSAAVVPAVLGVVCVFLTAFASLPKLSFLPRIVISTGLWFCLSSLVVVAGLERLVLTFSILVGVGALCFYLMECVLVIPSAPPIKIVYTKAQLSFRAVCAGIAVMTALLVSKFAGPMWGGVASAFPVANFASLIILQKTAGLDFTRAMSKAAVVSVVLTTGTYVALAHYAYPAWGLLLGTAAPLGIAACMAYGTFCFLRRSVR